MDIFRFSSAKTVRGRGLLRPRYQLQPLHYSAAKVLIRIAAKEKLEIVKSRGRAAPLKTAKEPGEKHRLEPYFNFGGRKFFNPILMPREYFKFISAVHLFLVKDGKILLLRRFNTGYQDGNYSVPAGHIDGEEKATSAIIREAKEEGGININEKQLRMVHVMHRKSDEERIDFFFEATEWQGEPKIIETNKCDDLSWFPINQLPQNIIPYVKAGIENYGNKISFSEFGWN